MEIKGPEFFRYDARHLQVARQLGAESIKPNVLRDVNDSVAMALLLTDVVELTPQARKILEQLRQSLGQDGAELAAALRGKGNEQLIYTYKQLRDLVYGKPDQPDQEGRTVDDPNAFVVPLGGKEEPRRRPRSGGMSEARELVMKMIVATPSEQIKRVLATELEILGEKVIDACKRFGVRIVVLGRRQVMSELKIGGTFLVGKGEKTFDGRPWDGVRGIYDQGRRLMVLGEETVANPRHSAPRHEFAHAFDHTFTSRNQRRLPLSVQLWNLFQDDRSSLVSEYAATNPAEYFAECVEAYFRESSRAELAGRDPRMHEYLTQLFSS